MGRRSPDWLTLMAQEMGPKRLEFAHQLVPNGNALAALVNPKYPLALSEARDMQAAARSLGLQLAVLDASTQNEIDAMSIWKCGRARESF